MPKGTPFTYFSDCSSTPVKRMARRFGLNRADRFTIDKQRVVRLAGLESKLAHGDAARGREVHRAFVLHHPTARAE